MVFFLVSLQGQIIIPTCWWLDFSSCQHPYLVVSILFTIFDSDQINTGHKTLLACSSLFGF